MAAILLNSVYQTGAGSGHPLAVAKTIHGIQVLITDANASITALSVKLQGTLESLGTADSAASWFDIGLLEFDGPMLAALMGNATFTGKLAKRVRANITVITGAAAADNIKVIYQEGAE